MSRLKRSIKVAYDKTSGKRLEADQEFSKTKDSFEVRKSYHSKEIKLTCCECDQDLIVSSSKFDRLHFKHKPGHSNCILSDGKLSLKDQSIFTKIHLNKESPRHIELKTKIGNLLSEVDGVDKTSISIDDKFIIRDGQKRRPDVFCNYKGHDIVFEIQLSQLSLSYILSRYEFYKKHKMFLIWILDDFDIHNQGTLERDIKYLTEYENFFKLDESSNKLKLICDYKSPFLTDGNKLLSKWQQKSVELSQLNFDTKVFQVYYYNFGYNKSKKEVEQKVRERELEEIERQRQLKEERQLAITKCSRLIEEIRYLKKNENPDYKDVKFKIFTLTRVETTVFNELLNLKNLDSPILKWIYKAKKYDYYFLDFIISCDSIEKNLNEIDSTGCNAINAIIKNENLIKTHKTSLIKRLLEFGYNYGANDLKSLEEFIEYDDQLFLFEQCGKLKNRRLVPDLFKYSHVIFIIESAKRNELIGYYYKSNIWIQLANNAIKYYHKHWDYIESAFKYYGVWDKVEKADRKGKFRAELEGYYYNMPEQNYDIDDIINELYPEIYH